MIFRLYFETRGGDVHARLFAGKQEGALGKCGDLTMRQDEFSIFVDRFAFIDLRAEAPGVLKAKDSILAGKIAKRIIDFCYGSITHSPDDGNADRAAEAIVKEFLP